MAKTYVQIRQEIEALQREANALRAKEIAEVVERIRQAIEEYGLTAADLDLPAPGRRRAAAGKGSRRAAQNATAARYRDAAGNTWGGRGPRPQWLRDALAAGQRLEEFAV
jgi:DNA-binding protein H-NS